MLNLTISENAINLRVVPKLFYPASSQYVHQFYLLNTSGNIHILAFPVSSSLPYLI